METVGKVTLNYQYYSGNDAYSDGSIEDELLDIVKNHTKEEYDTIIKEKKSWPILYHLSDIRENILNWFPFEKDASVLEIGAGCGAISGVLARSVGCVTAVDLSKRRSLINAYKNAECDNLSIIVGDFNVISAKLEEKYDYITLIGVLEYAGCYIQDANAADLFLQRIKSLLKPEGKIIIAIENRLGMKYFAGCAEDHVGRMFEGIEGYPNTKGIRTYSKKEISTLLSNNGFSESKFYYPYPDYKLPNVIFSDERLPQKGELKNNLRNYDTHRLMLFDEQRAFDSILDAGLFDEFSNSFLIVASGK
ncbi:MAG: class I SAM-dependent methyltransferase [Eubacteriales bacterium]|nr:class I SAM-dependent methyltransferase [Eubacteriales bacterium]